jgi:hypothetical protein
MSVSSFIWKLFHKQFVFAIAALPNIVIIRTATILCSLKMEKNLNSINLWYKKENHNLHEATYQSSSHPYTLHLSFGLCIFSYVSYLETLLIKQWSLWNFWIYINIFIKYYKYISVTETYTLNFRVWLMIQTFIFKH